MTQPRTNTEISRLKARRRTALLDLAAKRMGYPTWGKFGTQFTESLAALPEDATAIEVNAAIRKIIARLKIVTVETPARQDKELEAITAKYPRLRKWVIKKTR